MPDLNVPEVVIAPREKGGWLAVSSPGQHLRLAVVGDDEQSAKDAFRAAAVRWLELCELAADRRRKQVA